MVDDAEQLKQGKVAFNRGQYFLAHELWEVVWRRVGDVEQRGCLQGLIQIAAGLHHLQEGRRGPGATLLRKGLEKLSRRRNDREGPLLGHLRLDLLADQVARLLVELDAPGTAADLSQLRI